MKKVLSIILSLTMLLTITAGLNLTTFGATSGDYKYKVLSNGTAKITSYIGSDTNVEIPSKIDGYKVSVLFLSAFSKCEDGSISVTIPKTVTKIDNDCMTFSIKSITVSSDSKKYSSKDGVLFNKAKTKLIEYPSGKSGKTYNIPNTVITIGSGAFDHTNLNKVKIPNSVKTIGESAFYENLLSEINIPNSVTSMGEYAFCWAGSNKIKSIKIGTGLKKIPEGAFLGVYPSNGIIVPKNVTSIGGYAFGGYNDSKIKVTILNSKCKFANEFSIFTESTRITLYGYSGSTTQSYAKKYSKTFKKL